MLGGKDLSERITGLNQAAELVEKMLKGWIGPMVVDPQRKKRLESAAGLVGRVLADTDPTTGEFVYRNIRDWIEKQRGSYAWREIKDANGNSFTPKLFAPSDEDTIVSIAAACLIPAELPVPLSDAERQRMEGDIASFLGAIERSAENRQFAEKDWAMTIDMLSHNPVHSAIRDFFSAVGLYGGEIQGNVDDALAGLGPDPATSQHIKDWAAEQAKAAKKPMNNPIARILRAIFK